METFASQRIFRIVRTLNLRGHLISNGPGMKKYNLSLQKLKMAPPPWLTPNPVYIFHESVVSIFVVARVLTMSRMMHPADSPNDKKRRQCKACQELDMLRVTAKYSFYMPTVPIWLASLQTTRRDATVSNTCMRIVPIQASR
ncbi:hypothetical protein LENED_012206 [Lentinula edodes]|uniref:Uncharacterized protein n=1 Tax=Lentinula edodes TaxID=5353 RepID=A0A1Q3ES88_LENED|nr:hypothetical protein LENED_012206 [Lentinula edodes]